MASGSKAMWWCAWPGLRQLWLRGSFSALVLAIGLSGLLNLLVVSSLLWTEWFSTAALCLGWGTLIGTWSVAALATWYTTDTEARGTSRNATSEASQDIDPLSLAIDEYLQGKWYETEAILRKMLRRDRRDIEARLMLASLCRHTDRLDEAQRKLDELTAYEAAAKWQTEIETERKLLEKRSNRKRYNAEESAEARNEAPPGNPEMTKAA